MAVTPADSPHPEKPQPPPRPGKRGEEPSPLVLLGAGGEVGLAVAALMLLGWWLDGKLGTKPWLLLAGAAVGIIGGLYNLYRQAKRFFED